MASPEVMFTVSLSAVATAHSFWCHLRISNHASRIRDRLKREAPEAWSELNFVARNWNGGQPAIKLLYQRRRVNFPEFDTQVEQLLALERRMLWSLGIALAAIGAAVAGTHLWGWR